MNSETGSKVSGSQVNPGRPACSIGATVPPETGAARRSSSISRRDASTRCWSDRNSARYGSWAPSTCDSSSGVASDIDRSKRSCSISFA